MFLTLNLTAGQAVEFVEQYDHLRLMDAASGVTLEFYRAGREVDEALGVATGYSESFAQPCDKLRITNGATAQTVTFATRMGSKVSYDKPPTGAVTVTGTATTDVAQCADVSEGNVVVGTASVLIAPWDTRRRGLMLQNQSDTATIWIAFNGSLAAVGNGMRLKPGETFYHDTVLCMKSIYGISDTAGTTLRVVGWQK